MVERAVGAQRPGGACEVRTGSSATLKELQGTDGREGRMPRLHSGHGEKNGCDQKHGADK